MPYLRTLITGLTVAVGAFLVISCGAKDEDATTSTSSTNYTFSANVEPILKASCAGNATCHGTGETTPIYVGNKAQFIAVAEQIISRVDSSDAVLQMPKPGYGISLSDANKKILKDYLAQKVRD